ncbi:MAG: uncharacterized protein QOD77_397 [Thermoplasmata archaeon]|nr:uncharacterized protein [Thermoplasmata archaeon]
MVVVPVVLDTNAILLPFTQGTRLEEPLAELLGAYELHLPTSVIPELQRLSENQGATGRAAKMALKFSERCVREPTGLMGDDGILQVARRLGAVVFTNDRKLQLECVKSGLRVLVAREREGIGWYRGGSG